MVNKVVNQKRQLKSVDAFLFDKKNLFAIILIDLVFKNFIWIWKEM